MLAEAVQAEVDVHIGPVRRRARRARGRWLVVRNGSRQPREVLTSAGAVELVVAPGGNDHRTDPDPGARRWFCSAILPPWCRKTPR